MSSWFLLLNGCEQFKKPVEHKNSVAYVIVARFVIHMLCISACLIMIKKINDRVNFIGAIPEDNQQLSISSPCGYKLYSL